MEVVRNDFYVEDEPIKDVKHDWKTGQSVLVLPASFKRRAEKSWLAFRQWAANELRRVADLTEPTAGAIRRSRIGRLPSKRGRMAGR